MIRDRSFASNISALLICGLLAGVVVAAAAFPTLAVAGLTAKAGSEGFQGLPVELKDPPAPQTSWLYANDGTTLITSFYDESRKEVDLDEIAPVMKKAIVAAEDNRFYEHNGVDPVGVIRAGVANRGGGEVSQGASTLTMQYVRQALTYNAKTNEQVLAATEDTPERKVREMRYAVQVEKEYSKKEILQRYLNLVFLGNQSYGIYAASHAYFDKDPRALKLPEAALLAALPKAPGTIDPSQGDDGAGKRAKDRRNWVLDRMIDTGAVSKKEGKKAKESEIELNLQEQPSDCTAVPQDKQDWGFFCDFFKEWWMSNPQFGSNPDERLNHLKTGGYSITSTLDPDLQEDAQKAIDDEIGKKETWALGDTTLNPKTGHVRSMAVNRNYSINVSENGPNSGAPGELGSYPNTTVPLLSGGSGAAGAGFQAGSTFKMFTMVAALEKGYDLTKAYDNPGGRYTSQYGVGFAPTPSSCGHRIPDGQYAWCPGNDNPSWMSGKADMWRGFGRSVNTYFVQLIEDTGAENAVKTAEQMGIDLRNNADKDRADTKADLWGSFTLGVADTTSMDLAEAYGTVANKGKRCDPLPVMEMTNPEGKTTEVDPSCEQVIDPDVAAAAADAARCPVGDQSADKKCDGATFKEGKGYVDRPLMGKTGTTQNNQASWYVASTPNATTAGFIADPDSRTRSLPDGDKWHQMPHRASSKALAKALEGLEVEEFPDPPKSMKLPPPGVCANSRAHPGRFCGVSTKRASGS